MKRYILLALSVCQSLVVLAAEAPRKSTDANLFGHVVDRETHEHIPYASVAVVGTAFGTTTDASGHYFLKNLPVGELTLEVRALGYASGRMTVALERGETRELNFEVAQSGISMDEVVVSASRSATLRREAPALVSVLDAALFEKTNASCLAQGLSFQPGVRRSQPLPVYDGNRLRHKTSDPEKRSKHHLKTHNRPENLRSVHPIPAFLQELH